MRKSTRLMGRRLGVVGVALAISVAGAALGGCGGSSGEGSSDQNAAEAAEPAAEEEQPEAEADAQAEESEEEKVQQWFQTLYKSHTQNDEQSWVDPEVTYTSKSDRQMKTELDEHGNPTKTISTTTFSGEGYDSETEEVSSYTLDEKGWPVSIDVTTTSKSYSVAYEQVEEYDEEGNPIDSFRPIEDGGSLETAEPTVEEKTITFSYERDDEGRVTKVEADDPSHGSYELTYQDNGKIASVKHTSSYENGFAEETETVTYSYETRFDEKGKPNGYVDTTIDSDGTTETLTELDADGNATKETTTVTGPDGTKHELVLTYELEKDDKGNVVKATATASGDGEGSRDRWVSMDQQFAETFGADGSISAQAVTYDENYNEVLGEAKVYDGPYSVTEFTYDDDGNVLASSVAYYDGTTTKVENSYDEDGNVTKTVNEGADGLVSTTVSTYDEAGNVLSSNTEQEGGANQRSEYSYEWVFVEEPSEYAGTYRQYIWW